MHHDRLLRRPLRRDPLVWVWLAIVAVAAVSAGLRYIDPGAPFHWELALAFAWEILVAAFWALVLLLLLAVLRWLIVGALSLGRRWRSPSRHRADGPIGPPQEQLPHAGHMPGGIPQPRGVLLPPSVTDDDEGHPPGDLRLLTISGRTIRHDEPLGLDWHVPDADQVLIDGEAHPPTGHLDLPLDTSRTVVVQAFAGDRLLRSVALPVTVLPPPPPPAEVPDWLGPPAAALESALTARPLFAPPPPVLPADDRPEGAPDA